MKDVLVRKAFCPPSGAKRSATVQEESFSNRRLALESIAAFQSERAGVNRGVTVQRHGRLYLVTTTTS